MNILSHWLGEPLLYALGWTLLHSLWQCAAAAIALAVALKFIRPQAANKRYVALLLALVVCLASSIVTFTYYAGASPQEAFRIIGIMPSGVLVTATPESPPLASVVNQHLDQLVTLWLVGSCLFLLRYSINVYRCFHHKNHLSYRAPELWQKRVNNLAERLKLNQRVILKISHCLATPCVIGHLKPVILLPIGLLTRLPDDQIEAILLHEMAHIRRHDFLIGLIQQFCKSLYFFNLPFLWICKQLDAERENACDDAAVACCGDPMLYARSLQQFSELSLQGEIAMAFNNQPKHLLARVKRIFDSQPHVTSTPQGFLSSLLSLIVLLCASFYTHSSLAGEKYPEITTLDDSAIERLMREFKEDIWVGPNTTRIITSIERVSEFESLTKAEKNAFSKYLRENLFQKSGWESMPQGEYWSHLNETQWEEVKNIQFNNLHQQFFTFLESPENTREIYNVDLSGYSQPAVLAIYPWNRVELSIPEPMFTDIASGKLEVMTNRVAIRIQEDEILIRVSETSTTENELNRLLDPQIVDPDSGSFRGGLHFNESPDEVIFFDYKLGQYQLAIPLSLADKLIASDYNKLGLVGDFKTLGNATLGMQLSNAQTVDIAMQPSKSRGLIPYLPDTSFVEHSEEDLEQKIAQIPQELKPYLLTDKDIKNKLRVHEAHNNEVPEGSFREFLTRLYQSLRADQLIEAADDQQARQKLVDNPETHFIINDNTWVSLTSDPMETADTFDFEVEDTDLSQAVALAQAHCPGLSYTADERISQSYINFYGYDMTCGRLETAFDQLGQNIAQKEIE